MPTRKTKRRSLKGGSFMGNLLHWATAAPPPPGGATPQKKNRKITAIRKKLAASSIPALKSFLISNSHRKLDLHSIKALEEDGFEPEGDDTAKFLRVLDKLPYAQLKKFNNNPALWSTESSELFFQIWRSTPTPRRLPTGRSKKPRRKGAKTRKASRKKGKTTRR